MTSENRAGLWLVAQAKNCRQESVRLIQDAISDQHGIPHRARVRRGQFLATLGEFLYFFLNEHTKFSVGGVFARAVADASPREKVGTVADVSVVFVAPADEFEVTVFGFHWVTSRMA